MIVYFLNKKPDLPLRYIMVCIPNHCLYMYMIYASSPEHQYILANYICTIDIDLFIISLHRYSALLSIVRRIYHVEQSSDDLRRNDAYMTPL